RRRSCSMRPRARPYGGRTRRGVPASYGPRRRTRGRPRPHRPGAPPRPSQTRRSSLSTPPHPPMGELAAPSPLLACALVAGQWGVATQSKFLAVGSIVPWASPGVGAVATQALANPRYGPDGLSLLAEGLSAEEVVARLTEADGGRSERQLGVVDARGGSATY